MKPVTPAFRLVHAQLSRDTVRALERLLDEAKGGKLIGISYAAMYEQRAYVVGNAGECHRNPTFTRGMVAALDDYLREMVHK